MTSLPEDVVEEFENYLKNVGYLNPKPYLFSAKLFCEYFNYELPTMRDLVDFFNEVRRVYSPRTLNVVKHGVSRFYEFLIVNGLAKENPLNLIKIKPNIKREFIYVPTKEDIDNISYLASEYLTIKNYEAFDTILKFATAFGFRYSELANQSYVIYDDYVKIFGKRLKERIVPFLEEFSDFHYVIPDVPKYVNNKNLSKFRNWLRTYSRKVVGRELTPHDLRRVFATELYRNGRDLIFIKEVMGHESLNTILNYIHLSERDVLNKLKSKK